LALEWEALVAREPALAVLYSELAEVTDDGGPSFCANKFWYIHADPRLTPLVGRNADTDDPLLRSTQAYEVSRKTLFGLLPDCRNCVCLPW
jgi:hypothetical protein